VAALRSRARIALAWLLRSRWQAQSAGFWRQFREPGLQVHLTELSSRLLVTALVSLAGVATGLALASPGKWLVGAHWAAGGVLAWCAALGYEAFAFVRPGLLSGEPKYFWLV
jgi:hypothetical protein